MYKLIHILIFIAVNWVLIDEIYMQKREKETKQMVHLRCSFNIFAAAMIISIEALFITILPVLLDLTNIVSSRRAVLALIIVIGVIWMKRYRERLKIQYELYEEDMEG